MANNKVNKGEVKVPEKHWLTALLLCWFLGFLGIHRMYAGKIGSGFLQLYWTVIAGLVTYMNVYLGIACFVGVGAVVVNDFVLIAMKKFKDCYGREISEEKIG
ncbi:MAG: TM2 domain-containing protein [Clostridia bacterium]|nr:TM2 domain-containing protein [Clostridia bacterium]